MVKVGQIYQHFKGNYYHVEDFATHTETGEELVLYRRLERLKPPYRWGASGELWARPMDNFVEQVSKDGVNFFPRFKYVDNLPE